MECNEKLRCLLCRELVDYVQQRRWWAPGHGNLRYVLEAYEPARDGKWHLVDVYNQRLPPYVQPLRQARFNETQEQTPGCIVKPLPLLWQSRWDSSCEPSAAPTADLRGVLWAARPCTTA